MSSSEDSLVGKSGYTRAVMAAVDMYADLRIPSSWKLGPGDEQRRLDIIDMLEMAPVTSADVDQLLAKRVELLEYQSQTLEYRNKLARDALHRGYWQRLWRAIRGAPL